MSIGKTKKEPLKGPTAPYDGYDEREDTEEKVRQALAFLQVLFYFPKIAFGKNYRLIVEKSLTATVGCFIIKTDQWSKMSNGKKRSKMEPGKDMKNRANMKKEGK